MRLWCVVILLNLAGCTGLGKADRGLTVYSGRGEALVGDLLARAAEELEIRVQVQYGSTPDLVTRMMLEGPQTQADLILAQEASNLHPLVEGGRLAALPEALVEGVDPRFIDPQRRWVGTSGRLRVLVVNEEQVPVDERPRSLRDLADSRYAGKLAWAPSNGSFQAHVAALHRVWGEQATREWLSAIKSGKPRTFPKNSPIVQAVGEGAAGMGWVNHYYLHQGPARSGVVNHSFEKGDLGNLLLVAGVGVREGTPAASDAERLVAWLLSEETQERIAKEYAEYPTRLGVGTRSGVPTLAEVGLHDEAQGQLVDPGPARELLRDLGLL